MARVNDSAPFQVSLFPVGGGQHYIRIRAKVRAETKTKTGDQVQVRFTVLDRADVAIPDDLLMALRAEGATEAFKLLPPGKRNFMIRRIDANDASSGRPNMAINIAMPAAWNNAMKLALREITDSVSGSTLAGLMLHRRHFEMQLT